MAEASGAKWSPQTWKSKPIVQGVTYDDTKAFDTAVQKLNMLPPLVTPLEIVKLKNELREVALGNAFLLQGGDCAELFDYCNQDMIEAKIKLLLQMSLVLRTICVLGCPLLISQSSIWSAKLWVHSRCP